MRAIAVLSGWLVMAAVAAPPVVAGWTRAIAERFGMATPSERIAPLARAVARLDAFPATPRSDALAAEVGHEGHWTFRNRKGETFTAATPAERARVASVLAPAATGADSRLTIVLTDATAFLHPTRLDDLPRGAALHVAIGDKSYPLVRRGELRFADIDTGIAVALDTRALFEEAIWQLARPLAAGRIRLLSLEPGGPHTLASTPRIDVATGHVQADAIDPFRLAGALKALSGQTALLIGRVANGLLHIQPASGAEVTVIWADLVAAAVAADINLVLLQAATPRQPGTRNWLWRRIEVAGLADALRRATLADFLTALAAGQGRLLVTTRASAAGRVGLAATIEGSGSAAPSTGAGGLLSTVMSELTGRLSGNSLDADLVSRARAGELSRRLLPSIPSALQLGYAGALLLGLVGLPRARRWWRRVWPPEHAADYAGASGYHAARLAKLAAFTLLFMPLVAVVSAPVSILTGAWWRDRRSWPA